MATNAPNSGKDSRETRKIILLMGMGLNGISAGGWIPPADTRVQAEEMIADVWAMLESVDTLIIGRVTFQLWEEYWPSRATDPSSSDFQKKFSLFAGQAQKMVFSTTLKNVHWQNSRVIADDIRTEISRVKELPGRNIAVAGGAGIAQTFIQLNLIDDYQLYVHPVIFGQGKSLFQQATERNLKLIDVRQFRSGGLRLHYRSIN